MLNTISTTNKSKNLPLRILFVEDNQEFAQLVERWLTSQSDNSIQISQTERVDSALHELETEAFDLMLLDLGLHDTRGIETITALQGVAFHLPMVVLTGENDPTVCKTATESGAACVIDKKSARPEQLLGAIRNALLQHENDHSGSVHTKLTAKKAYDALAPENNQNSFELPLRQTPLSLRLAMPTTPKNDTFTTWFQRYSRATDPRGKNRRNRCVTHPW